MAISSKYCIYFGTVRGVIGNTFCDTEKPAKYEFFDKGENAGITCMKWGRTQDEIIIGQSNGQLQLYDTLTSKFIKNMSGIDGEGAIVGAAAIEDKFIIGRKSGHIVIWNDESTESFELNLNSESTMECMFHNKIRNNIIATGGEKNDLKLWDIETKKAIFQAKSMGHDKLNLPIRTSIRDISFLGGDGKLPSCCTKEGYVLLYDERAQRRPVSKLIEPIASYTTMTCGIREKQCFVGTTKGYMQLLDLTNPAKCIKTFKTFTGSISSIVCDPVTSIVASVSLDKHLQIHDIDSKELLYKEYLKQSLTKVLLKPIIKEEKEELENDEEDKVIDSDPLAIDEEYDKIFENMETVGDETRSKSKNKKRLVKNIIAVEHKKSKKRKKE